MTGRGSLITGNVASLLGFRGLGKACCGSQFMVEEETDRQALNKSKERVEKHVPRMLDLKA